MGIICGIKKISIYDKILCRILENKILCRPIAKRHVQSEMARALTVNSLGLTGHLSCGRCKRCSHFSGWWRALAIVPEASRRLTTSWRGPCTVEEKDSRNSFLFLLLPAQASSFKQSLTQRPILKQMPNFVRVWLFVGQKLRQAQSLRGGILKVDGDVEKSLSRYSLNRP